jgi:hypothetical protein
MAHDKDASKPASQLQRTENQLNIRALQHTDFEELVKIE